MVNFEKNFPIFLNLDFIFYSFGALGSAQSGISLTFSTYFFENLVT